MKLELTPGERRALRAQAHHLGPVVMIGHDGLTPPVVHEIDVNLAAHGLIKIRVLGDDRDAREAMLDRICDALDAAPVQHIGKLLVVYRPLPDAPRARDRKKADEARPPSSRPPRATGARIQRDRSRDARGEPARDRREQRTPNSTRRTPAADGAPRGIPGRRRRTG